MFVDSGWIWRRCTVAVPVIRLLLRRCAKKLRIMIQMLHKEDALQVPSLG